MLTLELILSLCTITSFNGSYPREVMAVQAECQKYYAECALKADKALIQRTAILNCIKDREIKR